MKRVDLVVATATALLATGLVLCAVMKCWGEANFLYCGLNLYHKAPNIAHYHKDSGRGRCLPGTIPHPTLPPEKRLSWIAEYKRHMQEAKPDTDAAWDAPTNAPLAGMPFGDVICPASGHGMQGGYAQSSYVGVAGLGRDAPALPLSSPRAGYFGHDRVVTDADIKRGTSNVIIILETASAGPWAAGGPATVRGIDPAEPFPKPGGPFGSHHHRGRVNALMADTSSRSFGPGIDPKVLAAMATLGGEGEGE